MRAVLAHLELLLFEGEPVLCLFVGRDAGVEGDLVGASGSRFRGDAVDSLAPERRDIDGLHLIQAFNVWVSTPAG